MKKIKKGVWEEIFIYPSFNTRFGTVFGALMLFFVISTYFITFRSTWAHHTNEQIAIINLIIQSATLILGIFAAYYALRQLVENRFTNLDEAASQELKRKHYSRAFDKWREAFYIKPDTSVFTNLCETLLLIGDFETFDLYTNMPERKGLLKQEIFQENYDQIILLYLKSIRHLLVKNQGEAEKNINLLLSLIIEEGLIGFQWDFLDMQTSPSYLDLNGECKKIAENLINYLQKNITPNRKVDFEKGIYATETTD